MRAKSLPLPQVRKTDGYNSTLNIKNYDGDNLYPNKIINFINNSPTATTCLNRYADFIEGNGLHSQALADYVVNRNNETLDDIHRMIAKDKAMFGGFALLVQYDIFARPCAIYHVPFEQARLEEPDSDGNVAHVVLHPDWSGNTTRAGERISVNDENVDRVDVFNPDIEVVRRQITDAGGLTQYKGQIYYYSDAGYMTYPKPSYDAELTDISTDEGISNIMNRNARNGFFPAGMITYFDNADDSDNELEEQLLRLQGDVNACKILSVAIKNEEEKPTFTPINTHNYDKDFTATTDKVTERIYSAFGQEGWYCLRIGKTGFSGTLVADIENEYSKRVRKDQRPLTRAYMAILGRFAEERLPEPATIEALSIEPYSSIEIHNTTEI